MRDLWISHSDAFVLVYSTVSRRSFLTVEVFLRHVLRLKKRDAVRIMVVGTKSDLEEGREVAAEEGESYAHSFGFAFKEISNKSYESAESVFFDLVRELRTLEAETAGARRGKGGPACVIF